MTVNLPMILLTLSRTNVWAEAYSKYFWVTKPYNRATQMADRGPNPDLGMATAGPRQPLKGVFYTQKF